jgi:tetratricopeptide (TPR) repeat protein
VSFASSADSARAAWEAARPLVRALRERVEHDDATVGAAELLAVHEAIAGVLTRLAPEADGEGTAALKASLSALRQQGLCTLDEAHALVDFDALTQRLASEPTVVHHVQPGTREVVRRAEASVEALLRTALTASAAAPLAAEYARPTARPSEEEAVVDRVPITPPAAPRRVRSSTFVVALVVVCFGAAAIAALLFAGVGRRDPLAEGIAAYEQGQRMVARLSFERAATQAPSDARPLIYLGRLAREDGDLRQARRLLEQAVQRDAEAPLAHRELASALLADGQPELARRFYVRALALDPDDRVAQGFLGCALAQLGRGDEAQRWTERAGPGDWSACTRDASSAIATPPTP